MVSNTGTYIDCPFHRYEHGDDLNDTPLEHFAELKELLFACLSSKHLSIDSGFFMILNCVVKQFLSTPVG
jgi:kynurenine formamidase